MANVYFGVYEKPVPENNDRGWLLHSAAISHQTKTCRAFGWDETPSIVRRAHGAVLPMGSSLIPNGQVQTLRRHPGAADGPKQNRHFLDPILRPDTDPCEAVSHGGIA